MQAPAEQFLDVFPVWVSSLADDTLSLSRVLVNDAAPAAARRFAAAGLQYIIRVLDVLPNGAVDIGLADSAFVLRAGASAVLRDADAWREDESATDFRRLAEDAAMVRDFLGSTYGRLERYTRSLAHRSSGPNAGPDVVDDEHARAALVAEADAWALRYAPPALPRNERTLIKLEAFVDTKLPA